MPIIQLKTSMNHISKYSDGNHITLCILNMHNALIGNISFNGNIIKILNISPSYRRRGYGSILLREAENQIKDKGFKEVSLMANHNSWDFYIKKAIFPPIYCGCFGIKHPIT